DARWCEAELHRVQGEIAVAAASASSPRSKGRAQATREAERCLRRAIEVAQAQGARWWELRAWFGLARLVPDDGDTMAELRPRPRRSTMAARSRTCAPSARS